jgi:hypothetical protein
MLQAPTVSLTPFFIVRFPPYQADRKDVRVSDWVAQHAAERPVIVLRHAATAVESAQSKGGRRLQEVAELTEFEISQYQVRIPLSSTFFIAMYCVGR